MNVANERREGGNEGEKVKLTVMFKFQKAANTMENGRFQLPKAAPFQMNSLNSKTCKYHSK